MKIYKPSLTINIIYAILCILSMIFFGIISIIASDLFILFRIGMGFLAFVVGPYRIYAMSNRKISIDEVKIEITHKPLLRNTGILRWTDIAEVKSNLSFYPEVSSIFIVPHSTANRKFLSFSMMGMPIELLIDILSHVSPETKVTLYPYLEKRIAVHKKGKLDIGIRSW